MSICPHIGDVNLLFSPGFISFQGVDHDVYEEKPSDVLLWFINSRIVPWAGSTWELASDVHGFGFEFFLCYPLSRSYQITPIFGGLTK